MKTVQLAAVIVLVTVLAPAQSSQSETLENNLYSLALKTSIFQMEKEYGHIDDSVFGERMRTDYRHMIVEEDPLITKGLPTEFDNHSVEYLDSQARLENATGSGQVYAALVIRPMQNEGTT